LVVEGWQIRLQTKSLDSPEGRTMGYFAESDFRSLGRKRELSQL